MKNADYNRIAFLYEPLKKLIFANKLDYTQSFYLPELSSSASVLIIGGGRGKIIQQLEKCGFKGTLCFVEISENMIKAARRRPTSLKCEFHQQDILSFKPHQTFDAVITGFFFDQFYPSQQVEIIQHVSSFLKKEGLWMDTDFNKPSTTLQGVLMKIMYKFFRLSTRIVTSELFPILPLFRQTGYVVLKERNFFNQMISSCIMQKSFT